MKEAFPHFQSCKLYIFVDKGVISSNSEKINQNLGHLASKSTYNINVFVYLLSRGVIVIKYGGEMGGCKAHHKILRGSVAHLSYATALSGSYGKEKSET